MSVPSWRIREGRGVRAPTDGSARPLEAATNHSIHDEYDSGLGYHITEMLEGEE